jgi:glucose/arabinose dehydrogenase
MPRRSVRSVLALAALMAVFIAHGRAQQTGAGAGPQLLDVPGGRIRVVTVAGGLQNPWSFAILPDGRTILVTEREPARLRLVPEERRAGQHAGHRPRAPRGRCAPGRRGDLRRRRVGDRRQHGRPHALRSRTTLFVAVGDRDRLCCNGSEDNSLRMKAQDLGNHVGKTLRLRDDGGVPPQTIRSSAVPARSRRSSPTGTATATASRSIPRPARCGRPRSARWAATRSTSCCPGGNYGWPLVSMGRNYTGTLVSEQPYSRPGHGRSPDVLGAVHQPVEHHVLHRRQVPAMAEQPIRGCTDDAAAAAHRVQSTVTGRAPRAVARAARSSPERYPAES